MNKRKIKELAALFLKEKPIVQENTKGKDKRTDIKFQTE